MATMKRCCKCERTTRTMTCDGCQQRFCMVHVPEHQQEIEQQMKNIKQRHEKLGRELNKENNTNMLLAKVERWKEDAIMKIKNIAKDLQNDIKRLTEESKYRLGSGMEELSNKLRVCEEDNEYVENEMEQWTKQLDEFQREMERATTIELIEDNSAGFRILKIKSSEERSLSDSSDRSFQIVDRPTLTETLSSDIDSSIERSKVIQQSAEYPYVSFGLNQSVRSDIGSLFERLMFLSPMYKDDRMSSQYRIEIDRMEKFLSQSFGFTTLDNQYIVPNIPIFQFSRSPRSVDPKTMIYFPDRSTTSFAMTAQEIVKWQRSLAVYADKSVKGMNKDFLYQAMQGKIREGEAAFRMKFVVRISTCPIMMDSDMRVIGRKLDDDWPNRIKLVSTCGINFAGKKRDIGDIMYYISNWKDVFDMDPKTGLPLVYKETDYHRKANGPPVKLYEDRIRGSLRRMAWLRLQACDAEGVQVVVETGLRLGISAGNKLEIDKKMRAFSAEALRTVLKEYGSSFKNIQAVILALPTPYKTRSNQNTSNTFQDFIDEFQKSQYNGPVPVFIADQDVHRLAVEIARYGLIVSELCPTNSYNIFGGSWRQHESSHMEERMALTTMGLLLQHHLSNPEILNPSRYHSLETGETAPFDWFTIVSSNNNVRLITDNRLNQ